MSDNLPAALLEDDFEDDIVVSEKPIAIKHEETEDGGHQFYYQDGNEDVILGDWFSCVVIDWDYSNSWHKKKYDPKAPPLNPDCSALGKKWKLLAPLPSSPYPRSRSCDGCPHNQFDEEFLKPPRCQNKVRLTLCMVGDNGEIGGDLYQVFLSPSSKKFWNNFMKSVSRSELHPKQKRVILQKIEIYFNEDVNYAQTMIDWKETFDDDESIETLKVMRDRWSQISASYEQEAAELQQQRANGAIEHDDGIRASIPAIRRRKRGAEPEVPEEVQEAEAQMIPANTVTRARRGLPK